MTMGFYIVVGGCLMNLAVALLQRRTIRDIRTVAEFARRHVQKHIDHEERAWDLLDRVDDRNQNDEWHTRAQQWKRDHQRIRLEDR